jgi:signal transduction histidine kinase
MGYLQLLTQTELSTPQKELIDRAFDAVQRSSELIRKVRQLEKIKERRVLGAVSVDKVVQRVVSAISPEAQTKGVHVLYRPSGFTVCANELLEDLMFNLVENAVVHSDGNKVVVTATLENRSICRLSVEDNGRGIADDDKKKVFDKQVKGRQSSGSGIGLYLVQMITESYGGQVEVKDRIPGKPERGARFDVYLKTA